MNRGSFQIIVVLISMWGSASAAEWRMFNDPERAFSFEAPEPVRITQQAGTRPDGIAVETTLYVYRDDRAGQTGCAIALTQFGGVTLEDDTPQSTAAAFTAQLQTLKVQPDIDAEIAVDGRIGRRFEFKDLKGNGVAFRWFVIANRLFQLTCTTAPNASADDRAEVMRVTDSRHFLAR